MSWTRWIALLMVLTFAPLAFGFDEEILNEIRTEASRCSDDPLGRPLPLAGHWHTGTTIEGYDPSYQIQLLHEGHYFIPWFLLPGPGGKVPSPKYYEPLIKFSAKYKLPIVLISTQWERLLTSEASFFSLPADRNPNVVRLDGSIERKVSPFGPTELWREVGRLWGAQDIVKQLQTWYPDPPLVLFLSNNEHPKLRWKEVEFCRQYVERYGRGKTDEWKRTVVAGGWKVRYGALLEGIRTGLDQGPAGRHWKQKAMFVGYNAFAAPSIGRWPGWPEHSLHYDDKLSVWPEIWDGCSVPFYTHPWDGSTDYKVWSPQTEAMNWAIAQKLVPSDRAFWFELSTWDGYAPGKTNDKRTQYEQSGQSYSPQRYSGMVQFGMWLLRPRTVREFRSHTDTLASTEPYFRQVLAAVDRVHQVPLLSEFWRMGELVVNTSRPHPYGVALPHVLDGAPHWYRLETSLDPPGQWTLKTELPIFSLALVRGAAPERKWLLYAHAPTSAKTGVRITIPDHGVVTVDVPLEGGFWMVDELKTGVTEVL